MRYGITQRGFMDSISFITLRGIVQYDDIVQPVICGYSGWDDVDSTDDGVLVLVVVVER